MMPRKSQIKGDRGEIELMTILNERGYSVHRGGRLSYGEQPDLYGLPGIHVEVKRVETLNLSKAMQQSERDAAKFNDGMPTVFHRKNREPWRVTMNLDDFMRLYGGTTNER